MRAPISVIVPTLNAGRGLNACLAALMEGVEAGLIREVVVTDGGSADETLEIAKAWGAEIVSGAPSRGGQLRRGCATARGDWFLVIHADTMLSQGWVAAAAPVMQAGKAGYARLSFERGGVPGRIVAGWANLRSRFGLPYGDQGLLISRALYEAVGGYPDQPLMEDVHIARTLKGQLVAMDVTATTSAEKYRKQGWILRGTRNLWTLLRYATGADAHALARAYRK